jgi:hypothetical protein
MSADQKKLRFSIRVIRVDPWPGILPGLCTKRQFRASFKTGSNPQSDEEEFCQKG